MLLFVDLSIYSISFLNFSADQFGRFDKLGCAKSIILVSIMTAIGKNNLFKFALHPCNCPSGQTDQQAVDNVVLCNKVCTDVKCRLTM